VTPQRNPGDPPRIANPGHLFSVAGQPVSYQVVVASAEGDTLAFSATGLPDGLRIDRGTGEIAGTPTRVQTASVAVTVSGASGSFTQGFTWDIRPASPS
jgi:hypothetical protein